MPLETIPELVEVPWQEGARDLDDCTYLFAVSIREIEELTLGLTLVEAKAQAPATAAAGLDPLVGLMMGGSPIERDDTCRVFGLVFDRDHMISYTVLNESYGLYPQPPEVFTGKLFRIFSHSQLLEFTQKTTCASNRYPGPLMHFQIACLNHVIDVVTIAPPKIAIGNNMAPSNIAS